MAFVNVFSDTWTKEGSRMKLENSFRVCLSSTDGLKRQLLGGCRHFTFLKLPNSTSRGGLAISSTHNKPWYNAKDDRAYLKCVQSCKCYKLQAKGIIHAEERRLRTRERSEPRIFLIHTL